MLSETAHQLARLLEGDSAAAAWLYDAVAPRLFRRLRQRYGFAGGQDPEDLLQDAFLFFFQRDGHILRQFLERTPAEGVTFESLEAFLWNQACGIASNRRRSVARRQQVATLIPEQELPIEATAERKTLHRDLLARLEDCLRAGRERVFLYYVFRHRDGLAPEEISEISGWSKKATYKLKQALDHALAECAAPLGLILP
jgi:DNA-directed RNA polymerase specialized sigma24 family protein